MQKTYDIIGKFKYVIFIPIVVIVTGIFFNIFSGINLSIDFKGGSSITYSYDGKLNFDEVKKQAETALKNVGNDTTLMYSHTGTLADNDVQSALSEKKIDGITFSAENATDSGKSFIKISAVGKSLLTQKNIDEITALLKSKFAENNIDFSSKEVDAYEETRVNVISSTDFASGAQTVKINAIGNMSLSTAQLKELEKTMNEKFADNNIKQTGAQSVSESFGSSFFAKSLYAVLIASILVIIYVGYRFRKVGGIKAAITALVALIHDLAFIYCVDIIFGITIDTNFIAVFLTILGYSLNDTIVIYDRIRENSAIYGNKKSIRELTNLSISQSLKRTCVTSLTTFAAIMSVTVVAAIKGLDSILTFSIPMSIGVICGTFSSLFVAGPLYVFWCEHREKKGNKTKDIKDKTDAKSKSADYVNRRNPKKGKKRVY